MALGGWLAGLVFDHFGHYHPAFFMGFVVNLANIAIMLFLLPRWLAHRRATRAARLDSAYAAIRAHDPSFTLPLFLNGARTAFEMIVQAFAEGDRKTLKQLLSSDVYENFDGAMRDREARNEKLENTLIRIVSTDAAEAEVENACGRKPRS